MLAHLRPAVVMIALFTVLTGLAYPLAITAIAGIALPFQAGGSLLRGSDGHVQGSGLIAQAFARPQYLHPRPSAAGDGYDATSSSGSNLGPMDPKLAQRVAADAAALSKSAPGQDIPADAVTTSGSGLDPDISPANARLQAPRIAAARHVRTDAVLAVIEPAVQGPALGVFGQPHVNVLQVNRALDLRLPSSAAGAR